MIRKGLLFDTYDRIYPQKRCPKIILKTGMDYVLDIHYVMNVKTKPIAKNVLQIQHYKNCCYRVNETETYQTDNRMKQYSDDMQQKMLRYDQLLRQSGIEMANESSAKQG